MRSARVMTTLCARRTRLTSQARTGLLLGAVWSSLALSVTPAAGQTSTGQLTSRDELSAEIRRAEQSGNGMQAALRSELNDRLTAELLKYVKAENVNATPLTRIGVLGEVSRPGYFAVRS